MTATTAPAPRSRSSAAPILLLVTVGFLELTMFLTAIAMGASMEDVPILLLAAITTLVGAGPILFNMVQPPEKRQILITVTTGVYVVFLVVPVFTQLGEGEVLGSFHLAKYPPGDIVRAQLVALLGLAMLLLGFYLPFGRVAVSVIPKVTREWPAHAVLFVGLLTLALGWLVYIPGQLGLIPSRAGSGALGTIASGSSFGIALLTLAWLRHRRREALLLLAIMIPLSMLFSFFTGSKRMILTPPFLFALTYVVYERRVRMGWAAAGLAALIVLYPISNFYRSVVNPVQGGRLAEFMRNPGDVLAALSQFTTNVDDLGHYVSAGLQSTGRRLDGLAVLTQIVKDTPERVPYQGGRTIANIPLSYVPRILWPGKPGMTIGTWVNQHYGSGDLYTHVGPTWMGELFFNWGTVGVAFGMFVIGLLCRIAQERLFGWNAPVPALFAAVVVLYAVGRTVQGGLIGPVNGTVYNLVPILFAHYLVGALTGYQRSSARGSGHTGADLSQLPAQSAR